MGGSRKILVVDDDPDLREVIRFILARGGYLVVMAANGEEALEVFRTERPDAVILDLNLPDMGGHEVCRRIRGEPRGGRVPVLMCTVRSAVAHVAEGLDAGATDYLLKPFEAGDLVRRLAKALSDQARRG